MMSQETYVQGSLFEEGYLLKTLGVLVHSADIALTELVANAWDAGASFVKIIIPEDHGEKLIIEDDGVGLTKGQFCHRWMTLGYNRSKHQGNQVKFPQGREGGRLAYGQNGIGRHGLLCFNNEYQVITKSEGTKSTFTITTLDSKEPFVLKEESYSDETGHGTRLEVIVDRNLSKPEALLKIISARFLYDPQFVVTINGESVPLEQHSGLIDSKKIKVAGVDLELILIDSLKVARSTLYQGIAFWQSGRLVGEPSWILGNQVVMDGRTRFAKRYTLVVKTNDLAEYVLGDWTGFKKDDKMDKIYRKISEYTDEKFKDISKKQIEETKKLIKKDFNREIEDLSPLGKYEIDEAIECVTDKHPMTKPESISLVVETIINLEKTRSGKELLQKLIQFSDDDVEGLNRLLSQWTVKDALCVLDEIDRRLSVIEAISKLCSDKEIDELKILHPLITEARWLFGPEYDSPEYTSNRQLKSVMKELFKKDIDPQTFENLRKRPDLVILKQSSISVTGTDSIDPESKISKLNNILIIEIKRGGFEITRNEKNQIMGYVEDLLLCGSIPGRPIINAFIVGERISGKLDYVYTVGEEKLGKVFVCTYAQLVDTAEQRLFSLRDKLAERYDDIPGLELYEKTTQLDLNIPS